YAVDGRLREYLVDDVGSSLGKTGNYWSGSRGNADDFATSKFITKVNPETVDFEMRSGLAPVTFFEFRCCGGSVRPVVEHIPRTDARRIGQRLAQLSSGQIADCFRAAGYSVEEVDKFTQAIEERISELARL